MLERFAQFPKALAENARTVRLGPDVPVLLAHPDWQTPAPVVLWMHGRTVNKELDPGRYLRWIRAGIAVCSIDLPGHGERYDIEFQHPRRTLDVLSQMLGEIDAVVEALAGPEYETGVGPLFDLDRMAIGGMSAGGMAALRRLCDPHPFLCAAVEGATGDLDALYFTRDGWPVDHDPELVAPLDPAQHLDTFAPIPLLALHSEADKMVPYAGQLGFINALRAHYKAKNADPGLVKLVTWPETGAESEHAGFGRFANDAKNVQTDFLTEHLLG